MDEYIKREAALAICEEEYREQLRILNYSGMREDKEDEK